MNDTPAEVQADFRERFLTLDASRRLRMASGMFGSAKTLIRAGQNQFANDGEVPGVMMLWHLYRDDFDADELARISRHLRDAARNPSSAASEDA